MTRRDLLNAATLAGGAAALGNLASLQTSAASISDSAVAPIPDRLVVLTFDDGTKTDITHVAPVLKRLGFGASFYVNHPRADGRMRWEDIRQLSEEGFEIGNHSKSHPDMTKLTPAQVLEEVAG